MKLVVTVTVAMLTSLTVGAALEKPVSAELQPVEAKSVTVAGNAQEVVDTGITVQPGDTLDITGSGKITPGCLFCPETGPAGYPEVADDDSWPLKGARKFSLLGKLNGTYFYIGDGINFTHDGPSGKLYLYINDWATRDNGGSFTGHIELFREDPNTPPRIGPVKPAPGSTIRDRTRHISAVVSDAETELAQSNMKLFVDGRAKAFTYNAATDRLSRLSNTLAYGKHTVRIEATDGKLDAPPKTWSFRIVR